MSLENSIINGIYTSYVFVLYFKYIKTRSLFFIKHDITIFILELKKKNPYIHVIKSKQYCSINLKSLKILKYVDINIHEQNLRKCHIYFLRFTKKNTYSQYYNIQSEIFPYSNKYPQDSNKEKQIF